MRISRWLGWNVKPPHTGAGYFTHWLRLPGLFFAATDRIEGKPKTLLFRLGYWELRYWPKSVWVLAMRPVLRYETVAPNIERAVEWGPPPPYKRFTFKKDWRIFS